MIYVEVIVPLPLQATYSYAVSAELLSGHPGLTAGYRVVVPFGRKRYYTGIVRSVVDGSTEGMKQVEQILDDRPLVTEQAMQLWEWVAYYYMAPLGSVMRAALPAGLILESKTVVTLVEDFEAQEALSQLDTEILDTLSAQPTKSLLVQQLESKLGRHLARPLLRLLAAGAVTAGEVIQQKYRPRQIKHLQLAGTYSQSPEAADQAYLLLSRSVRQSELLTHFFDLLEKRQLPLSASLPRAEVLAGIPGGDAALRGLMSKGILTQIEVQRSRLDSLGLSPEPAGSAERADQLTAPVTLYYGREVAAKEEFLLGQVRRTLDEGGQVLFLTPSVHSVPSALGFLRRLAAVSGGSYRPYHTLVNEAIRVETYLQLRDLTEPVVVVGTKGAVFLPLPRLKLIVIDEEQEYLYKEQQSAPYYHARDVALWRAYQQGAQVLLASLTPSAESLFNAGRGKYAFIHPEERHSEELVLPPLESIDLDGLRAAREMPYGYTISPYLYEQIRATRERGEKVLLLQNRRGYAPYVKCQNCGERITCPNCDVSLTYHRGQDLLLCRYCGHSEPLPTRCPSCGAEEVVSKRGEKAPALRQIGYGIERVEEELKKSLPDYSVLRIDTETLSSQRRRLELLQQIEEGEADILLGTQLIKSQPIWENVGLVAVVQLDAVLGFPDFRSEERAYQLLYQLRLRLGQPQGKALPQFLIQVGGAEKPFISELRRGDYEDFLHGVLALREATHFPPFTRVTYLWLKARDERLLSAVAFALARYLQGLLPREAVSDAVTPAIGRIDSMYIRQIVLRRPFTTPYQQERAAVSSALAQLRLAYPDSSKVSISIDVDPL